jgi:hypothetical protein
MNTQSAQRAAYREPTAQELATAQRLRNYFPFSIVWAYLDGHAPGVWVWQKSTSRRSMNAYARKGFAVVVAS